jgi:hypothetical protein
VNNLTDLGGGIMIIDSIAKVDNCKFSGNSAKRSDKSIGRGGGIYLEVAVNSSISNCQFTNNKAFMGGAISLLETPISINGCLIKNNEAEWGGGMQTMFMGNVSILMKDCIIENNSAKADRETTGYGGGFMFSGGVNILEYCNIVGNYASDIGGGSIPTVATI